MGPIGIGLVSSGATLLGLGIFFTFITLKNENGLFKKFFKSYKKEEIEKQKELDDNKFRVYNEFVRMYNEIRNTFIVASRKINDLYSAEGKVNSEEIKKFKENNDVTLNKIINSYQIDEIEFIVDRIDYNYLQQLIRNMTATNSTAWRNNKTIIDTIKVMDSRIEKYINEKKED